MTTATSPGRYEVDLTVLGAGPAGLYATYYAGFRGLRTALVDSLPELGGQVTAMYPEKEILDVAGFPSVTGRELVDRLAEQAATADPTYLLGVPATDLVAGEDGVRLDLADGTRIHTGALIITAGIGTFAPRPLPAGEQWLGLGMSYFVPSFDPYRDADVVVVGGGDSALDWALNLEPLARNVTLIHRRSRFRAHEHSVSRVRASSVRVLTDAEVMALHGEEWLSRIEVAHDGATESITTQHLIAALGFIADLGPIQRWGIETDRRHIVVDERCATNLPRVFAAGDVTEHPGKVRLISVGFGEAATAVNNAATALDPRARLFPGHSSDGR